MDVDFNSPFLMCNMKEAVAHFGFIFDAFEAAYPASSSTSRVIFEQHIANTNLINAVACDGLDRWARTEKFDKWAARLRKIGFRIRPISGMTMRLLEESVGEYAAGFSVRIFEGAMQILWKTRPFLSFSSWRCMS